MHIAILKTNDSHLLSYPFIFTRGAKQSLQIDMFLCERSIRIVSTHIKF